MTTDSRTCNKPIHRKPNLASLLKFLHDEKMEWDMYPSGSKIKLVIRHPISQVFFLRDGVWNRITEKKNLNLIRRKYEELKRAER